MSNKYFRVGLGIVTLGIYLLLIKGFIEMYIADVNYVKADKLLSLGQKDRAREKATLAIELNPYEPAYYRQRAKINIADTLNKDSETQLELKKRALTDLTLSYSLNSKNLATIRNNLPLYFFLANKDLSMPSTEDNMDELFFPVTEDYLDFASEYTPNDVGVLVLVAKYQKRLGLTEKYNDTIQDIEHLRPDLLEWHPDLR